MFPFQKSLLFWGVKRLLVRLVLMQGFGYLEGLGADMRILL